MSEETYEVLTPAPSMPGLKVAILGTGKMGGILLQAFLKNNLLAPAQIFATVHHAERAQALSAQFGLEVTTDNLAAAKQADVILLGVKPIQVPALIEEIKPALSVEKVVLSFAASVKTQSIEDSCWMRAGSDSGDAEYSGDAGGGYHGALCGAVCFAGTDGCSAEDLSDGWAHGCRR